MGSEGGPEDPVLRQWWRGRGGLSPEEQVELFESRSNIQDYCSECYSEDASESDSEESSLEDDEK